MQVNPVDQGGCEEIVAHLLEGRSRLLYRGAEAESDALQQVAAWLQHRTGPADTALVERIQQELTPELVQRLERAAEMLRGAGYGREFDTASPFVPLFRQMLELERACERMHRSYAALREASGRSAARG
jgi:hypothetical protein